MSGFCPLNLQFNNKRERGDTDVANSGLHSKPDPLTENIDMMNTNCTFLEPSYITQN